MRVAKRPDAAYRQTWQAFRQYRLLADGRHESDEWKAHAGRFVACLIRVPAEVIQPALDELRAALGAFPFIRVHPDHFLHIMLQELGYLCDHPAGRFELARTRLNEFVAAASDAISDAPSFDLRLGGANSFQDSCFLDVHDRGACARLHARLHELAAVPTTDKHAYLPHMTIAHYTEAAPIGNLPAIIAQFRDRRFGDFRVSHVEVVMMDPSIPYPSFDAYATFALRP